MCFLFDTYDHELWVGAGTMRLWIHGAEMMFLCRVSGLSLRLSVRSSDIQKELGVVPLLLSIERSWLR